MHHNMFSFNAATDSHLFYLCACGYNFTIDAEGDDCGKGAGKYNNSSHGARNICLIEEAKRYFAAQLRQKRSSCARRRRASHMTYDKSMLNGIFVFLRGVRFFRAKNENKIFAQLERHAEEKYDLSSTDHRNTNINQIHRPQKIISSLFCLYGYNWCAWKSKRNADEAINTGWRVR